MPPSRISRCADHEMVFRPRYSFRSRGAPRIGSALHSHPRAYRCALLAWLHAPVSPTQPFSKKRDRAGGGRQQPREMTPLVISLDSDDDVVVVGVPSGEKKSAPSTLGEEKKKRGLPLLGASPPPPPKRQTLDDSAPFGAKFEAAPLPASHAGTALGLFPPPSSSAAAAKPAASQQAANQEAPSSPGVLLGRGLRDEVSQLQEERDSPKRLNRRLSEELNKSTGKLKHATEKQQQQQQQQQEQELLNLRQQVHELQQQAKQHQQQQELVRHRQASQGLIVPMDHKIDELASPNTFKDLRGIKAQLEKNEKELQDVKAELADREEVIKHLVDMFDAQTEMRNFNGGRSVSPRTELDVALMTNKRLENHVSDLTDQHEKDLAAQKEQHKQELAAEKAQYERRLSDQKVQFEGEKHPYILQAESQQAEAAMIRQDMEAARLAHSEEIWQLRSENQLLAEQKHQAEQQALQAKEQQCQAEEGRREAVSQHADDKATWEATLTRTNITMAQRNSQRLAERRLALSKAEKEKLVRARDQFASDNKKLAKDNAALTKKVNNLTEKVNNMTKRVMTKEIKDELLRAKQDEAQAQSERRDLAVRYDALFARLADALTDRSRLQDQLDERDVELQQLRELADGLERRRQGREDELELE
ncbi:hypothetical protein B0T24DRAFT_95426 [Lasiosphaeria ovina]|uniref:Uncharacterized protein n=1 Tax=Lasiosphaeria ovina TaxID=92902 RepID=A0AAE0JUK0_9PEZI|nr:hypothetical protein B0T24DRAFT_95426 [Lasiosphaeria ovina]